MKEIRRMKRYYKKTKNILRGNKYGNVLPNSFVRDRKMPFMDLIYMILGKKGRTTAVELLDFYKKAQKDSISKQDFSKQRKNIKESYWIKTLEDISKEFYSTCKSYKYKGFKIFGIDGSKVILPRCEELEEKYGIANANNSQQKCVQCTLSGCYDLINHVMVDIQIAPYASDERELAKENIKAVKKMFPNQKLLFVFDRGYPSIDMMNFLQEMGVEYIFRSQESTYEKEKREMKSDDEEVEIKITRDRLTGKMSDETKEKLKQQKVFKTRFVKCTLSTGNVEWLITSLDKKKFSADELKDLYFKRWEIEKSYDTLKNKLQIENISGKTDLVVRQDIYATIIVFNMVATISRIIEEEGLELINSNDNKYEYKINQNVLIGAFKDMFIEIVITENEKTLERYLKLLHEYALRYKTAIIPDRSYKREFKGGSLKCKVNFKRPF